MHAEPRAERNKSSIDKSNLRPRLGRNASDLRRDIRSGKSAGPAQAQDRLVVKDNAQK
jgi:hypothetical protein